MTTRQFQGLERLSRVPAALLFALITALLLAVVFLTLPGRPLIFHSLQKLAHPTVFAIISVSVLVLIRQRLDSNPRICNYFAAFSIALLLGASTEYLQSLVHRDPSWRDVILDGRGALTGLCLAALYDAHLLTRTFGREIRLMAGLLAFGLIIFALQPPITTLYAYLYRDTHFPELFNPNSESQLLLVSTQGAPATVHLVDQDFAHVDDEQALSVPLYVRPGAFSLDEPPRHWLGYRTICVDLTNPGHNSLTLEIRLGDGHFDRTNAPRAATIQLPGRSRQTNCVDISSVKAWGRLDLNHITQFYLVRTQGIGVEFLIHRIWLKVADQRSSS